MHKLIHGLHQFQEHIFGSHRALFERLAHGQRPEVMLITCSDSRIVPALLTQTGPGELFVLRNAGGIVPAHGPSASAEAATIEFAIVELGIRDIVVCGHTGCGAMCALFDERMRASMPALDAWLDHAEATRRLMLQYYKELSDARRIDVAGQENVLVQLENLRTHPAVHAALAGGALQLHGWMYKLEAGSVHHYDPKTGEFEQVVAEPESAVGGG
jgi:carbonic anhydrase